MQLPPEMSPMKPSWSPAALHAVNNKEEKCIRQNHRRDNKKMMKINHDRLTFESMTASVTLIGTNQKAVIVAHPGTDAAVIVTLGSADVSGR
jgi:hypothetical protein